MNFLPLRGFDCIVNIDDIAYLNHTKDEHGKRCVTIYFNKPHLGTLTQVVHESLTDSQYEKYKNTIADFLNLRAK